MKDILNKNVYIIIPVHNRKNLTLQCLEQLKNQNLLISCNVVLVDDGSTDGTKETVAEDYPEVNLLLGDGNLWWTGAIVLGMEYAVENAAELIIWLNDDCILESQALKTLIEFLETHPRSIAGAVCYAQETNMIEETGAQGRKRVTANPGEVVAVDEMSGYCVGIHIEVVKSVGFPNAKKFPHYYGDSAYILKATRSGFPAYILGDVKVKHPTARSNINDFVNCFRERYSLIQILKLILLNKKSPYFALSQLFYNQEKYGFIVGSAIFMSKLHLWIIKILKSQLFFTD
jgi:GT2 family glycosyltransferase